jgi:hypothetical protein
LNSANECNDSKAQYIRQFKKWGFAKYSTEEKWQFIAQRVQKRELEGKESETYINGNLMSRKKLQKEISRHVPLAAACIEGSVKGRSFF